MPVKAHHILLGDIMKLEHAVGHPLKTLRSNPYMEEVWTLNHPDAAHSFHFFKANDKKYSAKGVVVEKGIDIIVEVLPSMADMKKLIGARGFGWKLESFYHPLYLRIGEIAFRRCLGNADFRVALAKNDGEFVRNYDPLIHSLFLAYGLATAEIRPGKEGIWPYEILTWNSTFRAKYHTGKELSGRRKLTYRQSKHPELPCTAEMDMRFDVKRRCNTAPNLTITRRYLLESWPNSKTFVASPENKPYLDILLAEADSTDTRQL
ncbi:hypothetical protein PARSHIK_113 [Erwinia phage vB_EamM_Parshik]|uniref:Uncharacterized protein n=1 Tax=Erwinia phage vB_EamM_Huxley TaxID=1883373 RepID=A0A1B2IDA1_9CAUD|nr:hypothetical protein BIZ81_gp171 [Erwinia phage vB_EamM_Huxley]ANZ49194.1 hypothetical protein HUXLEY_112 [Erwinia phage vB_EamM_Huxley]ANZ50022.1 hypothetical protein PARSHIK_113 [Erwinia phage vB_EamM_Parshik]